MNSSARKESPLNVTANRTAVKWSGKELAGRVLWDLAHPLFALSPRPLWGWRRMLLRLFGAHIGREVHIYPSVRITIPWNLQIGAESAVGDSAILYCLGPVRLGQQVTISQYAHICAGTHDHTRRDMPLVKAPVTVGDGAWICADTFIGPGVSIGARAIVGARCTAMNDVAADTIVIGNPAVSLGRRSEGTSFEGA